MSPRLASLLALLFLLPGSDRAASAKRRPTLVEEYSLTADVGLQSILWSGSGTSLLLAETLNVGSTGFIYDPYLASYAAHAGITDVHFWAGDWRTLVGWNAGTALTFFPMTAFPLLIELSHTAAGFSPGGFLPAQISNVTNLAGRWMLLFPSWPIIRLDVAHVRMDTALSGGLKPLLPGPTSSNYQSADTYGSLEMRYQTSHAAVSLRDHYDVGLDSHSQQVGFSAGSDINLPHNLAVATAVNGQVGQVGVGAERATLSTYYARLGLSHERWGLGTFGVHNSYGYSSYRSSRSFSDDLVGEAHFPVRSWLTLRSGVAGSVGHEESLGELESTTQTVLREQAALAAHLRGSVLRGPLLFNNSARFGSTQVLGQGSGALLALASNLDWSRVLHPRLILQASGAAAAQWDWSPLGTDAQSYLAMLRAQSPIHWRVNAGAWAAVSHSDQQEPIHGTFTVGATDLSTAAEVQYTIGSALRGSGTLGYSRTLSAGAAPSQDRLFTTAQLSGNPLPDLSFSVATLFSTSFVDGAASNPQFRFDAGLSWSIRQLFIFASYQYRIDDYVIGYGGDHVLGISIMRHFEARFGGVR